MGRSSSRRRGRTPLAPYLVLAAAFVVAIGWAAWRFESAEKGAPARPAGTVGEAPKAASSRNGEFRIERVETSYPRNPQAGLVFVLTGRVAPVRPSPGGGRIRVRVSVLGAGNRVIAQKTVTAGVSIPDEVILLQRRDEIDRAISEATAARASAAPTAEDSLPFQAVFFDVAGKVGSYELAAEREQ